YNSIARNNIVYNEPSGIYVSQSHNNQLYSNTISNSGNGIYINSGSTNNKLYDNTLMNSKSHAIVINSGSNANTLYSNKIVSTSKEGLEIDQDATSKNNILSNNRILDLGMLPTNSPKSIRDIS
ncbi:MAG: right-handed parallel beta-helix repeat-containing protein, partial [Candidatus Nitrosopolaris sp.]